MNDVVIAGAGPNGLMLACELALAGIRPIVLDPLPGPNPEPRANGVTGQGVRILDHRGFYSILAGTDEPPQPSPWAMFAALTLDLAGTADTQNYMVAVQQPRLVQVLAERAGEYDVDIRWGHRLTGFDQRPEGVTVHIAGPDGDYELAAKYLVGADGGTSQTRKLAGIDFPGRRSGWYRRTTGSTRSPARSISPGGVESRPRRSTAPNTASSPAAGSAAGRC
jgi:2-polyprenyl-6-methoxyphenol hydroxylase-like FAD-dependent oxidoreductase